MKKLLLCLTLIVSALTTYAHDGTHDHGEKSTIHSRNWHFSNNALAANGTFLLTKKGKVFVELEEGVSSFEITKLSWMDQKYIQRKQKEIAAINASQIDLKVHNEHKLSAGLSQYAKPITYCLAALGLWLLIVAFRKPLRKRFGLVMSSTLLFAFMFLAFVGCSNDADSDDDIDPTTTTTFTKDATAMNSAFTPYSNVSTRWDSEYFYIESNGIPEHQMMVNITAWIAQVPVPHDYTGDNAWSIPLTATYADSPINIESEFQRGAIGVASNGIPIFNPLNASGLISQQIGELDDFGGHSGRGDDYHYHTAPLHLETTSGLQPIAYALDGFPVFGSVEPDGTAMISLDSYHGHEYADDYHYHGTNTYPYMIGAMRGEVTLSGTSPQSQIEPQPVASAFRGDPHGINSDNLIITSLVEKTGGMGYVLTYTSDGTEGSVDYSWDANNLYTFIFNDINGSTTTETFQR